ncbi:MAG: hypothetical protein ACKOA8_17620, partial [Deltaproteobacteria bacterium]
MRILYLANTTTSFAESTLCLTPKVYLIKNSLYLDIEPTIKFFKGEETIFLKAMELAAYFKLNSHFVLTDRPEWAQALHTQNEVFIPKGKSQSTLLNLNISRLEWIGAPQKLEEEKTERKDLIKFMKRVGLKTISDFTSLNVTAIGRRFGRLGINLLDWILGQNELHLPIFTPENLIQETIFTEELTSFDSLMHTITSAFQKIELRLIGRGQSAKALELNFGLESETPLRKHYQLSEPFQKSEPILTFLKEILKELSWDSPLQHLEIKITETTSHTPGQLSLFETGETIFSNLYQYLTKLRAKFGDSQVGFPLIQESYLPEKSWMPLPTPQENKDSYCTPQRPLFLFSPPKPCFPSASWKLIPTENLMTEWWS